MRWLKIIGWLIVAYHMGFASALSQGLFESSQSGNHDNMVSKSFSMGGFLRSVSYLSTIPESNKVYAQSLYSQAGLIVSARAGEWATGKADIRFTYGTQFQQSIPGMEIREVYINLHAGILGLKVGKFISPWGKGSVFNPVEKITPVDPTFRSPDEDDMYLGTWAMQGSVNLGQSMRLSVTWKPLFQSSVLLIDPLPMPDYVRFIEPSTPDKLLSNGSLGIKYDLHIRALDASIYWFDGFHHWPGIGFNSFSLDTITMVPLDLSLQENAYRIRMLGMDFNIPFGPWIIRCEGSWFSPSGAWGEDDFLPFPELSYTAEIERSGTCGTLMAGYYGKQILDYAAPLAKPALWADEEQLFQLLPQGVPLKGEVIGAMVNEQVKSFNRLYNYQLETTYHSLFLVWSRAFFHEQLEVSFPVIYHLTTKEWILRPDLSIAPVDGIKISIGYSGLLGVENTLFDMVGPVLNAGYVSLKLIF